MISSWRSVPSDEKCCLRIAWCSPGRHTHSMHFAHCTYRLALALTALLSACDSTEDSMTAREQSDAGAPSDRPSMLADPRRSTELPAICPNCVRQAGGDTSDLGGGAPACRGSVDAKEDENVMLEQARARGFDPDALLAPIDGVVIEGDVRWAKPKADAATRIRVELAGEGTATIHHFHDWDDRDGRPPCHDGDYITVDVRISIATADGWVAGSFVAPAGPGPWGGSTLNGEPHDGFVGFGAQGDAAAFRGTLALGPSNAETPVLQASFAVWTGPEFEPRVSFDLDLINHYEQSEDSGRVGVRDDFAYLLPTDGCYPGLYPHSGPLPNYQCAEPEFGEGCCVPIKPLFASDDADAGASETSGQ
jgi:hypothetical protein